MGDGKITCGMCGVEFSEAESSSACGKCSLLGAGGCQKVRCPRCGYEMPPPARLTTWIEKMMKNRKKASGGEG